MMNRPSRKTAVHAPALLLLACCLIPVPVRAEPPEVFRGELRVLILDEFDSQLERTEYALESHAGKRYRLEFGPPAPKWLRTGQEVLVHGRARADRIDVRDIELQLPGNSGNGQSGEKDKGGGGTTGGSPSGDRSVIVLLINLVEGDSIWSFERAYDVMWGPHNSVQDVYSLNTFGKIRYPEDSNGDGQPDIFGPIDLPMSGSTCSYSSWAGAANQLAIDAGYDVASYDHKIYVLPSQASCSWAGLAELGGNRLWIRYDHEFVLLHELGHNLGLHHAGTDPENDGVINGAYGDGSCSMGASYRDIFLNAPHNESLGILSSFNGAIDTASHLPGEYVFDLSPLALHPDDASHPQIIKMTKKDGEDQRYYFSLRNQGAYDGNLAASYVGGLSIHRFVRKGLPSAYLGTLADGEVFEDPLNGIRIRQLDSAADASHVRFAVSIVPTCDAKQTDFVTNYPASMTVVPGQSVTFMVSAVNHDGADCLPTRYGLSVENLPAAMSLEFAEPTFTLGPGEARDLAVRIHVRDAVDRPYAIRLWVHDLDDAEPHHPGRATYSTVVVNSHATQPLPPTDLQAGVEKTRGKYQVRLGWQPPASPDLSSYLLYELLSSGPKFVLSTSGTSALVRSVPAGIHTFAVSVRNVDGVYSELSDPVLVHVGAH